MILRHLRHLGISHLRRRGWRWRLIHRSLGHPWGSNPWNRRVAIARQAEGPPVELLGVVSGAFEESQRASCIRQAGAPQAEAALAERWVGAPRRAVEQVLPAGAAAGTSSCIRLARPWQASLQAADLTVWALQALGMLVLPSATYSSASSGLARQALSLRLAEVQTVGTGLQDRAAAFPPSDQCHFC